MRRTLFGVYVGVLLKYADDDALKYTCGTPVETSESLEARSDDVPNCPAKLSPHAYTELSNFATATVCPPMGTRATPANVPPPAAINLMGGKTSPSFITSTFVGREIKKLINKS